jgi:hypothetical protein
MRTSILIKTNTRDELRRIGRKAQTYDDIINELIKKIQNPPDANFPKLTSSG